MSRFSYFKERDFKITEEQKKFYFENGYLLVKGLFSKDECKIVNDICESYADADYSAILNLDRENEEIHDVLRSRQIVSILEQLYGLEFIGLLTQILFKKAGSIYASQAWNPHQDNAYVNVQNGHYVTANFALQPFDQENGCMYVIPGSHKDGLRDCEDFVSFREKAVTGDMKANPGKLIHLTEEEKSRKIILEKEIGDCLFMEGHLIHGSFSNESKDRSRPMFSCTYTTKGASYIIGHNANRKEIALKW